MTEVMRVLSLGWGVQSMTLAVMAALGDIEPVDVAIHSDTTHERADTYAYAEKWTPWLEEHGVQVVTVRDESKATKLGTVSEHGGVFIPAFTTDGFSAGQLRRQCTGRWKIQPLRRWLQANRNGQPVEQLIGISLDEAVRMGQSDVQYIANVYPLIDKRMTRWDCQRYLDENVVEIPPRSACVFCPYKSRNEWRDIRDNAQADWQKAIAIDHAIRRARPPHDLFVNVQRKTLEECDLDSEVDRGQLSLWENECEGMCGI